MTSFQFISIWFLLFTLAGGTETEYQRTVKIFCALVSITSFVLALI